MPSANDPSLLPKALAKAQSVEDRLNTLIGSDLGPQSPAVMYNSTTTVVQQTTDGTYTWTCPAGVTSVRVQVWGAGAGGGGGSATIGGEGGGGGAYAEEPNYPVVPGTVYNYLVGNGGDGAITAHKGVAGGDSWFDDTGNAGGSAGVYAFGGAAGLNYIGGAGGAAGPNSIAFAGGNGGGDSTQSTGGCGGGSSASPEAAGHNGTGSTSSTGGAGGSDLHGADQGAGGNGGNSAANGSAGGSPGGGGGGCGSATGSSQVTFAYQPTSACTYFGSDAAGGNANKQRTGIGNHLYQGGTTASGGTYNGTQKSVMIMPSTMASDLSGVTIDSCTLSLYNLHSYNSTGQMVVLSYGAFTFLGSTYNGAGTTGVKNYDVPENQEYTISLTSTGLPAALKSGAATALVLGPGPAYNDNYYGYFVGANGGGGTPTLNITGHTGSANVTAGAGTDGEVRITYSTDTTPIASVQPVATTDSSSNALGAGFTGAISAFQPGASPSVVETWHAVGSAGNPAFANGWANQGGGLYNLQFKLQADNTVHLIGVITSGAATNNPIFTLPSGYVPAVGGDYGVGFHTSTGYTNAYFLRVSSSGAVSLINWSTGTGVVVAINIRIPLDNTV